MTSPPPPTPASLTLLVMARSGKESELLQALDGLAAELEALPGCRACVVARDIREGMRFLLHMDWENPSALAQGLASEAYRTLVGALSTLGALVIHSPPPVEAAGASPPAEPPTRTRRQRTSSPQGAS